MVYLKHQRKYKQRALGLNSTDSLDLPEGGILSAIQLEFEQVNAAGLIALVKQRVIDHITALEITDGGTKKMFSLTGQETKALDFYTFGKVMPESAILYDTNYQRSTVVIPFGEFIGDPKHALDLASFDQVNLDITNDFTTAYVAAGALKVDVKLLTLEDLAAKPPGYYKSYEWKSEVPSGAGQYVNHKIPTTDKIRRLMCQIDPAIGAATAQPENSVTDSNNLKLYFQERTQVVLDHRPKDLMRENAVVYGMAETHAKYPQSTTVYSDSCLAYMSNMPFGSLNQAASGAATTANARSKDENTRFFVLDTIDTGSGNPVIDAAAIGEGYYGTAVLFDSFSPDESMFLDASKSGSGKGPVEVEWYASAAAHKFRSFLTVPQKQGQA